MLELKLQYFGHLTRRTDSLENILKLGKIEGRRRRDGRLRWLDGMASPDMSLSKLRELVIESEARCPWGRRVDRRESECTLGVGDGQGGLLSAIDGVGKSRTRLSD